MAARTDDPIYRQIEAATDLYQPAVYQLLSFFSSFQPQSETLDGQFIPLTTVHRQRPEDTKIFAVGLIPPANAGGVSRLLDRSASVRALEGSYASIIARTPDVGSSSTGDLPGETSGLPTSLPAPVGPTQTDSTDFYDQFVAMCVRLGCQPEELAKVIQSESSWNEKRPALDKNGRPVAKGLIQLVRKTAKGLGMTEEQYNDFENTSRLDQLPWIEKFYKGRAEGRNAGELKLTTFGHYNNPDGSIWHGTAEPQPPDYKPYREPAKQREGYEKNINVDGPPRKGYITVEDLTKQLDKHPVDAAVLDGIRKAKERLGMGPTSPYRNEEVEVEVPKDWPDKAKSANDAAKTRAQSADKSLNLTDLGQTFQALQQANIKAMRDAIKRIADAPPLRLLINPQSFTVSSEKLIGSGNWGRSGPIIEHWGEQQDKIEGSGKIAAYFSLDAINAIGPGLSRNARQYSTSYQNLLSLFLIYRNNGGVWLPDPTLPANTRGSNLSVVGSVYLYYDNILYIGSFDSLALNESDDSPFSMEFTFSFTVRAWYVLDRAEDARYTYGRPQPGLALPTSSGSTAALEAGSNPQPSPSVRLPSIITKGV